MAKSSASMASMDDFIANEVGIKTQSRIIRPAPTGVDVLDLFNGRYYINKENEPELFMGLPRGKFMGVVGYTGVGKTTIVTQAAVAQTLPYIDVHGVVHHFDLENAWSYERVAEITQLDIETVKRVYRRYPPYSIDKIYSFVKKLVKFKAEMMEDPKSDIWVTDHVTGEQIPVPTTIIIDTVAALQMEDVLNEKTEFGSFLAEPGAQAKANNMFAQRVTGLIGDVNINIIWINHIRSKVDTGPVKKAKTIQQMGQEETLPGGTGFPQYAEYLLKLQGVEKLGEDDPMQINGKIVKATMIKSRQAYDGRTFEMVLTAAGFDNIWSNLYYMRKNKLIRGAGAHLFFETSDGRVTKKFSIRNFKELMTTDADFYDVANQAIEEALINIVPEYGAPLTDEVEVEDIGSLVDDE